MASVSAKGFFEYMIDRCLPGRLSQGGLKNHKEGLVEKGGVHFSCGDWYQKTVKHKKRKKTLERTPKKHSCNSKAAKFKKKSSPKIA